MGKTEAVRSRLSARRVVDSLLAVLLAPPCAACAAPLDVPTAGPVCEDCWRAVRPLTPPICDGCGLPLSPRSTIDDGPPMLEARCPDCADDRPITRARAAGAYSGALREIIHAFKYQGRQSLARPLAARMRDAAGGLLADADFLVPVPLHRSRLRERGFNQAALLARELGLPCAEALVRVRPTRTQTDLPAERRQANVRGAFALRSSRDRTAAPSAEGLLTCLTRSPDRAIARWTDLCLVLVDDVTTTGSTLNECARVLRAAGAPEVRAVTAARAL
jgi:predicted amidophosphoribosyltransferase